MKPRASKLDQYAEKLADWFLAEKITLAEAAARLKAQHGCSVSTSRLGVWLENYQQQQLQDKLLSRIATGAQLSGQLEKQFGRNPAPELDTILKVLRVLVMQLSVHGQATPDLLKLVSPLMRQVMDHLKIEEHRKDRALDERRVKILEAKAAQLDNVRHAVESDMTPEAKQQKIREIFGMR